MKYFLWRHPKIKALALFLLQHSQEIMFGAFVGAIIGAIDTVFAFKVGAWALGMLVPSRAESDDMFMTGAAWALYLFGVWGIIAMIVETRLGDYVFAAVMASTSTPIVALVPIILLVSAGVLGDRADAILRNWDYDYEPSPDEIVRAKGKWYG